MKKLRVAVIGCGNISVMHLDSIVALDEAELVAVCDIKPERATAASKKYHTKAYLDYHQLFEQEKPDVVHLCLPHYLHTVVAREAFKAGIHVLSEKPMSISYEDAVSTVELAEQSDLKYGVIFQCRYNTPSMLVKKRIMDGRLGPVKCGRTTLTWYRPDDYYEGSDWKGTWDKEGGGVVIDQAIHSIDLVHWLVNSEVESVSCSMANRGHKIVSVEDSAEGLITYKNGVKYGFYCMNNYGVDEPIEIKLYCEKGKVTFGYDDAYIEYFNGEKEEAHQDENTQEYEGGKDYWGFQHIRQISQFYKACLGEEELEISGEEALKTHRLIMEIYAKGGMRK